MGSLRLSVWLRRWWAAALLMCADDAARLAGAESAASLAASQGRLAALRQRQERAEGEGARASREREGEAQKQLQLARRRLLAEHAARLDGFLPKSTLNTAEERLAMQQHAEAQGY